MNLGRGLRSWLDSGLRFPTLLRLLATLRQPRAQPRLRSELLTRLRFGADHFQGSTFTQEDRFPVLFAHCRLLLASRPAARVLCFGCSTGEEVWTLARYLPEACITGVDLNRWCLARARDRQVREPNPHLHFLHTHSAEFTAEAPFDAVFALAVFQRTENAQAERALGFRFATFERALVLLDSKLSPGGVLFLDQCDFAFADTAVAGRYEPLRFPGSERPRARPLFGRDDCLQATAYAVPRAFRKLR